eukprot:4689832-Pyramimonas_sp.AAC.1
MTRRQAVSPPVAYSSRRPEPAWGEKSRHRLRTLMLPLCFFVWFTKLPHRNAEFTPRAAIRGRHLGSRPDPDPNNGPYSARSLLRLAASENIPLGLFCEWPPRGIFRS